MGAWPVLGAPVALVVARTQSLLCLRYKRDIVRHLCDGTLIRCGGDGEGRSSTLDPEDDGYALDAIREAPARRNPRFWRCGRHWCLGLVRAPTAGDGHLAGGLGYRSAAGALHRRPPGTSVARRHRHLAWLRWWHRRQQRIQAEPGLHLLPTACASNSC
jgi:hypothetical protein